MAYARSTKNAFGGSRSAGETAVRLVYDLENSGRNQGFHILAKRDRSTTALDENEFKEILPNLHPLDDEIAKELRAGQAFGMLSDVQVARLIPLLTRRRTYFQGEKLRMSEVQLQPRAKSASVGSGQLELCLMFIDDQGNWLSPEGGRVISGSQAYFIANNKTLKIQSPEPWHLNLWEQTPRIKLSKELTPSRRDQLTRDLLAAGVPEEDLDLLSVQRGAPDRFIVTIGKPDFETEEHLVHLVLDASYAGKKVCINSGNHGSAYIEASGSVEGLFERDLAAEDDARRHIRMLGFKYSRDNDVFVGKQELALKSLDPDAIIFPSDWEIIRSDDMPSFHQDLRIDTEIKLIQESGLLDLKINVLAQPKDWSPENNEEIVITELISITELLKWLQSGQKYLKLKDGTFVAPSEKFRRALQILEDLGADSNRILVSPLCIGLLKLMDDSDALRAADDSTKAWLDELALNCSPREIVPPAGLQGTLREYQARGLDWLAMLHRHRLTGILADDMGLGKTIQAIALLLKAQEEEGSKSSLVVAPTSVVTVWRDELERFAPSLQLVLWHGPPKVRHSHDISQADIIVTSYGVLRRDVEMLAEMSFRYIILDEAQSAKNAASQNATAIRELTSERRLALTGTPIENRPEELWATFDFLAPGFLGSLRQFRKKYARPIGRGEQHALDMLSARVSPLILRRLKTEVAKELPAKVESVLRCDLGEEQKIVYQQLIARLKREVEEKITDIGVERAHLDILAALTKLRQLCCDPRLVSGEVMPEGIYSAKLELFRELVREALASGRSIIIFSQFVEMQKLLIEVIKDLGVDPLWLHGGTRDRDKVVAKFQDPEGPPIIVVSLRAGGVGLTLTRADTVIHYDPWWNPAVERQATDRAHRLGQTQTVNVYKLVCAETIEERVVELAKRKEAIAESILTSEGSAQGKRITTSEVLALLQ